MRTHLRRPLAAWHYSGVVEMGQLKSKVRSAESKMDAPAVSDAVLADAKAGFEGYLRAKGWPNAKRFVDDHGEELMGRAQFEMVRSIKNGTRVENVPAFLITVAYRRAQNLLTSKSRAPDIVGLEAVAEIADAGEETPEDSALSQDRSRKIREAVKRLTVDERKVLALRYFEGLSLSKSARELGWDESKARRRHKAAMDHLHDLLGVDSADDLVVDVAFFCWLVVAFRERVGFSLVREIETGWHRVEDVLVAASEKTEHVAHKANTQLSTDPITATTAGNLGRGVRVCGMAALCLLTTAGGVAVVRSVDGGGSAGDRAASRPAVVTPTPAEAGVASGAAALAASAGAQSQSGESGAGESAPPPSVAAAIPPHASQPSPQIATGALEETSRPHNGPTESHPSSAPDGSSVGEGTKSSGKTEAEELVEKGTRRP